MLHDVIDMLECPVCAEALAVSGSALGCANGHTFDIARQGYVNLLPGGVSTGTADTADMVAARAAFLAGGHYAALAETVARLARNTGAGRVADIGTGTGYYLAAALDALPGAVGVGLDISKHALRRAAKAHPRIGAVVADAWRRLPLRAGSVDLALSIFAPRDVDELARVMRPEAALIAVTPGPAHMAQLVEPLGLLGMSEDKARRLADKLSPAFDLAHAEKVSATLTLTPDQAATLAEMGPTAYHVQPGELRTRAAMLGATVEVTLDADVSVFARR